MRLASRWRVAPYGAMGQLLGHSPAPAEAAEQPAAAQGAKPLLVVKDRKRKENVVTGQYRPLRKHPALFDTDKGWLPEWFDPKFLAAVEADTPEAWSAIVKEECPGAVFSCRIFTQEFCDMLIEEIDNFAETGLPARRPNSMNNYGIVLNEIGWRPMVDILQDTVLAKIGAHQWPHITPFDDHHTFIVRYKEGEDLGLDMHTDDSDVTFNICLGREFSGAGLQFCGAMGAPDHRKHSLNYKHVRGSMCWHLGRQRHGADDIASGERLNLIVWNQSSAYRRTMEYRNPDYVKESGQPDAVCLSYTHDRDYGIFKEYDPKIAEYQGGGWCPRKGKEYDGFQPEPEPPEGVVKKDRG